MLVTHRFPTRFLETISTRGRIRPQTLRHWAGSREPVAVNFCEGDEHQLSKEMTEAARRYGFYNMICHGQIDLSGNNVSCVTFNRIPELVTERQRQIAAHIMPHLHNCLLRLCGEKGGVTLASENPDVPRVSHLAGDISERQQEILHLISLGKTNWEISKILGTSVDNVKYHVKKLGVMFGATSRAAIVAQAFQERSRSKV